MTYISRNIAGKSERIIYLAHLHWIYNVMGFLWMIIIGSIGFVFKLVIENIFGNKINVIDITIHDKYIVNVADLSMSLFMIFGLFTFIKYFMKYISTEIALTNKRIVYKRGLIMVEAEEIDIYEIRSEHINQGMFGRFLRYGKIHLDSRFVGDVELPSINRPYKFLQALHKTKDMMEERPVK